MKLRCLCLALLVVATLRAADVPPVFNATLTVGKQHRFVLLDAAGKASSFLELGESFGGYALKSYDPKTGVLEVERDGKVTALTIAADAAVKNAPATPVRATVEDATALLNTMNFEQMMDRTMDAVKRQQRVAMERMTGQMAGAGVDRTELAALQKKMVDELMGGVTGAELKADVARIYSEVFTKDDLQALSAFYSSPAGQSFADKQPVVAEKMNELMMGRMMKVMPKVQQMARDFAAEQKAKRDTAGGGAAAPAPKSAPAPAPGK